MKKFDKHYFYYTFLSALRTVAVVVLIFLGNIDNDENFRLQDFIEALPFIGTGCALLYAAMVIHAWFYVHTSGYQLTDRDIRCKRGVLFRKSSVLPIEKVHAVNKKQGIIQRLFGIAVLTVDSGATTNAFSAEITIIEKDNVVDALIADIRCLQEGKSPDSEPSAATTEPLPNQYHFSSRLKVVYAILSVCGTLLALLILGLIAAIGLGVAAYLLRAVPDFSPAELLVGGLFLAALLSVLMTIISLIGGLVTSFVAYHDFTVHTQPDGIEIHHGLFVRQTNTFTAKRIKAVNIAEGPIKRLFRFATVSLEVVGYGNGSNQEDNGNTTAPGLLFPLCKASELDTLIERVMPAYRPDAIAHRAKSYPAFILWAFFGTTVSYLTIAASALTVLALIGVPSIAITATALSLTVAYAITLGCIAISRWLQYRHAGLTIGDGKITLQRGALVRTRTIIRQKDLVAIEKITTPMRQKRGIYSYKIHFFTNALTNTVTVSNLDAACAQQLEAMLRV